MNSKISNNYLTDKNKRTNEMVEALMSLKSYKRKLKRMSDNSPTIQSGLMTCKYRDYCKRYFKTCRQLASYNSYIIYDKKNPDNNSYIKVHKDETVNIMGKIIAYDGINFYILHRFKNLFYVCKVKAYAIIEQVQPILMTKDEFLSDHNIFNKKVARLCLNGYISFSAKMGKHGLKYLTT